MRRCAQENKEKRTKRLVFLRHSALFYGQQIRVLPQFLRTTAQAAARSCFCRAEISFSILLFNRGNNTRFSGVDIDQALVGEKLHSLTHGSAADVKKFGNFRIVEFFPPVLMCHL